MRVVMLATVILLAACADAPREHQGVWVLRWMEAPTAAGDLAAVPESDRVSFRKVGSWDPDAPLAAPDAFTIARDALLIFITTSSEEELVARLQDRKTETPEGLKLRIATARKELKRIVEFDYCVINPEFHLDTAVDAVLSIIEAEHNRVKPRLVTL